MMKVTLISKTADPTQLCGLAAVTCTRSGNPASALRHSVSSGHTSVLEHAVFTFRVEGLSRAALAQLTRHRLASFSVESQRYVKVDHPDLVIPQSIEKSEFEDGVSELMGQVMSLYQQMTDAGVPCGDARYILPMAIPTCLVMTMNARELLHFFSLRCCNRAQWEIRELADEMLRICRRECPEIFSNAGPGCVTGICHEKRPCIKSRTQKEWGTNL